MLYEITFYDQENGAEIGAELVNIPDYAAALNWAVKAIGDDGAWICCSIEEIIKEGVKNV